MKPVYLVRVAMMFAVSVIAAETSFAQYPVKPIRLVVLIAPGGAPDVGARVIQPPLSLPRVARKRPTIHGKEEPHREGRPTSVMSDE